MIIQNDFLYESFKKISIITGISILYKKDLVIVRNYYLYIDLYENEHQLIKKVIKIICC